MIGKIENCNREGDWCEYAIKDDQLLYKWSYQKDKRNGCYFSYTVSGKIETIGNYKNDVLDGVLVYFNLDGRVEKAELWRADGDMSELIYTSVLK